MKMKCLGQPLPGMLKTVRQPQAPKIAAGADCGQLLAKARCDRRDQVSLAATLQQFAGVQLNRPSVVSAAPRTAVQGCRSQWQPLLFASAGADRRALALAHHARRGHAWGAVSTLLPGPEVAPSATSSVIVQYGAVILLQPRVPQHIPHEASAGKTGYQDEAAEQQGMRGRLGFATASGRHQPQSLRP